ncbi:hypothetical protein EAH68_14580 [Corynebacterium hylobatis]|uniref:Nuclease SbcCD subunit C n=1 Tax=Corynebacterium hylobatis TaxID=1859290 RepID=A0A3R9ZCK2_9CORY|nr:AAA family ATPase [Corynebacterium hylobatis]RSZ61183.1 hypothetical protein EAH68_14580 [Corynebacterium hylobatis]
MLEQVTITGGACFGPTPLTIAGFNRVNFTFGPNGSGKTTISRAFAGHERIHLSPQWDDGLSMDVKVYNRDFVDRVLHESSRIPGVFVVGENSVQAETRLEEIRKPDGAQDKAKDKLDRARSSHETALNRQEQEAESFRELAWKGYKSLTTDHPELSPAFTGVGGIGNDKKKLVQLLEQFPSPQDGDPPLELSSLLSEAAAVFDSQATTRNEIASIPKFDPSNYAGFDLLGKKIVGSSDVTLSELVEKLGNSDWVSKGRSYLGHSNGKCPFCQQLTPATLAADLASMFDDHYTLEVEKIHDLSADFQDWSKAVRGHKDSIDDTAKLVLDEARYSAAFATLIEIISANEATLDAKERTPSMIGEFSNMDGTIDEINETIEQANKEIRTHNALIRSQREERPKLQIKCRRYLAEVVLGEELPPYKRRSQGLQKGVDTTAAKVAEAQKALKDLDDEIRKLQQSVVSTRPVIDRINVLLERSGFTSFKIVESTELEHGYMLFRDTGEAHENTLSEGERTFIAFLYYYHLLDGQTSSSASNNVLAVIDDPISSLDSDVLFVVSALVRELLERTQDHKGNLRQVVVLTHNVYFHKEVTQVRFNDTSQGRAYYVINKSLHSPSSIELHRNNPISTEYERLWGEIRRAIAGESTSVVGLENILRRILESYFRILGGGIWEEEMASRLDPHERPILNSLFNWINEGSHAIFEDVHYSPGKPSLDHYLKVFRRVFEVTGHQGHYTMMLYGKESLSQQP